MNHKNISIKTILILCLIYVSLVPLYYNKYTKVLMKNLTISPENSTNIFKGSLVNLDIKSISESDIFKSAEYQTNIALSYWNEWNNYPKSDNWKDFEVDSCNTSIPGIKDIDFNNIYWQMVLNGDKSEYFLYNAYYDNREDTNFVRIIGTQRHIAKSELWCLLYFEDKWQSIKTKAEKYVGTDGGPYDVVMFSCPVPKSIGNNKVPKSVSLTPSKSCPEKVRNSLRVIYEKADKIKQSFAVCHKALRFSTNDLSHKLIEWLELLRIFSVNKVYLYLLGGHHNMERTLNYYQNIGFVDWKPLTLAGEQPNIKYLYQYYAREMLKGFWATETIEYFDCFYRNIHKYEYIGIFDIDEVIVPKKADNWTQMFKQIHNTSEYNSYSTASFEFKSTRVFSDIEDNSNNTEKFMYSMRHLYRGGFRKEEAPKSIYATSLVKQMGHHRHNGCLYSNRCKTNKVDTDIGYILHFRIGWKVEDECSDKSCVKYDSNLLKYKQNLESNMKNVMKYIYY